jgi:hypothetical protein
VPPTGESTERVIIFIECRDTQRWPSPRRGRRGHLAKAVERRMTTMTDQSF